MNLISYFSALRAWAKWEARARRAARRARRDASRHSPPGHPADIVGAAMSPKAISGGRPAVGALALARQLAA